VHSNLYYDFISLFFPRYCEACANSLVKGEELICTLCWSELPKTNFHNNEDNELKIRFFGKTTLENAYALLRFTKSGKVQQLLHKLKYNNKPEIGVFLGKRFGAIIRNTITQPFDLIIPVPLHKTRLRKRGYNQSDAFAEGLSEALQTPWISDGIKRVVKSETQTRKTRMERWENVANIFELIRTEQIEGKRILLVDDVVTTGATLEACANVISQKTANISIATIAVA